MSLDIAIPEVRAHSQTGRFFRKDNIDYVEISLVGSKDTAIKKVTPEVMGRFRAEWDAFCDGRPPEKRAGIPLTDLPTIDEVRAEQYVSRNVHNLNELAALNDGQCQALGHGTLTDRQGARALVASRQAQQRDRLHREVQDKSAAIGPVPAEKYAANSDIEAVKADVAELKQGIAGIMELLQARKGGRPKKQKATE